MTTAAAVPLTLIRTADNVRTRLTGIDELAASIRELGVLQPIGCQRAPGGGLVVIYGHRRLAAAKLLGLKTIPAVINDDLLPDERLVRQVAENSARVQLDPIEEANAYRRLGEMGYGSREIAQAAGVSASTVFARLQLLVLPKADQARIRAGELTLGDAGRVAQLVKARKPGAVRHGKDPSHLSRRHPLAYLISCSHTTRPRVGGVGCGQCWEIVIRADERARLVVG